MKITKFGLGNFRVFKEYTEFDLKPLTILTGPNNSGKSSLSKALLLLQENEDNIFNSNRGNLNFSSGEHNLGSFDFVLNNPKKDLKFGFTFFKDYKVKVSSTENDVFPNEILNFSLLDNLDQTFFSLTSWRIEINFELLYEYIFLYYKFIFKDLDDDYSEKISKLLLEMDVFSKKAPNLFFDLNWLMDTSDIDLSTINELFHPLYENDVEFDSINIESNPYIIVQFIFKELFNIDFTEGELVILFPPLACSISLNITYLPTFKEQVGRVYSSESKSKFMKIIRPLAELNEKEIKEELFDLEYINEGFINKWKKEFGLGDEIKFYYDKKIGSFSLNIDDKTLLEYGYGITQIVYLLYSLHLDLNIKKSLIFDIFQKPQSPLQFPKIIIIEEPENGLHPAFQSKLAEMFVEASELFNVNFIIETHSEYFIRKLQYLTANNKIKPESSVIYYFNLPNKVPEGEEQVKRIDIDKNGSLSDNFGAGFIDEATNLKFELLKFNRSQQN